MLKQYDLDGKSTSYKPIAVKFGNVDENLKLLSVSNTEISVSVYSDSPKQGTLSFIEIDGKVLFQKEFNLNSGVNVLNIPSASSSKGLAIISFTSGLERKILKIVR